MSLVNIHNHFLENIAWGNFSSCNFVAGNGVDIWGIKISAHLSLLNNFLTLLNAEELARANRYLHLHDRNRFIISRGTLRIILGKYLNQNPASIEFEKSENKKPYLKNNPVFYNISHAGDEIVLAVSCAGVGIDIEIINPDFNFHDVINEYFSIREINFILQRQSIDRFFLIWTRKEAFAKATGKGLDDNIKFIPCLDGLQIEDGEKFAAFTDMEVYSFVPAKGYTASIAMPTPANGLRFYNADFF